MQDNSHLGSPITQLRFEPVINLEIYVWFSVHHKLIYVKNQRTMSHIVQKPSTLDALTGYFTPSHVKYQRLLLQFLNTPEDGRK
jgi:hypothetical protein